MSILTDFWTLISEQKWYNSFEIKACLLRYSDTDVWKITLLRIELLANERNVEGKAPINSNQVKTIDDVFVITSLDMFIQDVMRGDKISFYEEECSLELFKGNFYRRMCTRSSTLERHGIDFPCLEVGMLGDFTPEAENTIRYLDDLIPRVDHYHDLRDAVKRRLGIDHGTQAYGLQFIILAPIFIRIEQIQLTNRELTAVLNCYPEAELDLVKLVIFNRETKEDSMFMDDFIKIGDGTYSQTIPCSFSKLSMKLYHNEDLIEERFPSA
jgi:hypothetical protein